MVSPDPIHGVQQKMSTYIEAFYEKFMELGGRLEWVEQDYATHLPLDPTTKKNRLKSLARQWAKMQASIMKFVGVLDQFERHPPTGTTREDRIRLAATKSECRFVEEWRMLEKTAKFRSWAIEWQDSSSSSSSSNSGGSDGGNNHSVIISSEPEVKMGRDKAKILRAAEQKKAAVVAKLTETHRQFLEYRSVQAEKFALEHAVDMLKCNLLINRSHMDDNSIQGLQDMIDEKQQKLANVESRLGKFDAAIPSQTPSDMPTGEILQELLDQDSSRAPETTNHPNNGKSEADESEEEDEQSIDQRRRTRSRANDDGPKRKIHRQN